MAVDLVLLAMTPMMKPGHLVALLRNAQGSGFFDHDDADLKARNDAAEEAAASSFTIFEMFAKGPLAGKPISIRSAHIQALGLADRLPLAKGVGEPGGLHDAFADRIVDITYSPFVIDQPSRDRILDAVRDDGGDLEAATLFLDAHHGSVAFVVAE